MVQVSGAKVFKLQTECSVVAISILSGLILVGAALLLLTRKCRNR